MEKLEKLLFDYDGTTELYRLDSLYFLHGFIKWLVENDKIDLEKMEEKSEYTFLKKRGGEHRIEDVLMLLAISDTPIEDLISYLK